MPARSIAHRSDTSSTTQMRWLSLRLSRQIAHISLKSRLPHSKQARTDRAAWSSSFCQRQHDLIPIFQKDIKLFDGQNVGPARGDVTTFDQLFKRMLCHEIILYPAERLRKAGIGLVVEVGHLSFLSMHLPFWHLLLTWHYLPLGSQAQQVYLHHRPPLALVKFPVR